MRVGIFLAGLCFLVLPRLQAGQVEDLRTIHLEAIGGAARVKGLKAIRMKGVVLTSGATVQISMLAARPNRVRIVNERGARALVQVYDGETTPWEYEPRAKPPVVRDLEPAAARIFKGDSEFDDPLVDTESRGFTIDYAGGARVEGRPAHKLLFTRPDAPPFTLLLDADTYFIVRRIEQRREADGRVVEVVTRYSDFRPLEGVLLPFRVSVTGGGFVRQETIIQTMEANPQYDPAVFQRPVFAVEAAPAK